MTNRSCYMIILATLMCLGFALMSSSQEKPVTEICLGCICEAISGCNQTAICQGGVCGLFRITWAYWTDGGKLTVGSDSPQSEEAYPNCVNDPYCAANTIQNYMTKFGQDCNGDGNIDCYDYAAIHKLGGYGCKGELSFQYQNALTQCLSAFSSLDVRNN